MFKKDFVDLLARISTAILTVYGLISLPLDIIDKTDSKEIGIVFVVILALILGVTAIYHFASPLTLKRFGVGRHKSNPILISDKEVVEIDANFKAIIKTDKTLIYPEKPFPNDLVDIIEVSQSEKIDETVYRSSDCRIEKFVRKNENTLAVFWQPLIEIIPYVPYNHKTKYQSPSDYGDDAFWQAFHVDLNTGIIDWTFKCSHKVELAVAFQLPILNTRITYEKLDRLTFIKKRRDCSQPTISNNGKIVSWKLVAPKKNRSYVCFVFYEGGIESFRNSIDRRNWFRKIFPSNK